MIDRLHQVEPHHAFFLLKNTLWLPKLLYIRRTTCHRTSCPSLNQMDEFLRLAVSSLTNVTFNDDSWAQAVLPLRYCSLHLVAALFIPSDKANPSHGPPPRRGHRCSQTSGEWSTIHPNLDPPAPPMRSSQRAWDTSVISQQYETLLAASDQLTRARLLAASFTGSGAWIQAVPSSSFGMLLDPETLRIGVALRVGAALCEPNRCQCGRSVEPMGLHPLSCRYSSGRFPRHQALNDIVQRALSSSGVPSTLEPTGLNRGDGKRPDGMTLFPYKREKCLVWDATVADTYALRTS